MHSIISCRLRQIVILPIAAFAVLATAILSRPDWQLNHFDQLFYTAIAHDLDRWGVFSNGVFDHVDSTLEAPPPGMFFGPIYPVLVLAGMKIDWRFAQAVNCSVAAIHNHKDEAACEAYARPMRIIHALLLAFGALMVALAARLIVPGPAAFWIAGAFATAGLAMEAEIFSFVMTESVTFSLYSLVAFAVALFWTTWRPWHCLLAGGLLGALCLTRPSFIVLFPVIIGLSVLQIYLAKRFTRATGLGILAFALAFAAIAGGWALRNLASVGKFGLTQEYGSVVLIERFAYNDMTAREFVLAFPYCTPGLGDLAFDLVYGTDSMHRFVYHTVDSFFHVGRGRREALIAQHGRLDPIIGDIVREEMRRNWWRHLLVSIPLAWCGMWAGWLAGLVLIPMFVWSGVRAVRQSNYLLLLYAAPAITMLGLHAAVANHYTRYNLILIGPCAIGAAWIVSHWLGARWPRPVANPQA
jgi:hypothetical protein